MNSGPSGAGKSTTLSLIDAFVRLTAGTVSVLGHDTDRWPLHALRSRIAYVDQRLSTFVPPLGDRPRRPGGISG